MSCKRRSLYTPATVPISGLWQAAQPIEVNKLRPAAICSFSPFVAGARSTGGGSLTTNDVKAAHRLQAAIEELASTSAQMSPEVFETAYLQFLIRVQGDLGSLGPAPVAT